jgi:branched-chain amino acid transport system substrate-binding protein
MLAAACGHRMSHAELLAASRGTSNSGRSVTGGAAANGNAATDGTTGAGGVAADQSAQAATAANGAAVSGAGPAGASNTAAPGTPSAGGTAAATCAPKCSPIVIGSVGNYSGIPGQTTIGGVRALQAWVAWINSRGGIKGHTVKLHVADDGGDPSRHRSLIQQMVEGEGAIAFVNNAAPLTGQASVDYVNAKKVPIVGGGVDPWMYQSQYIFPQVTSGNAVIGTGMGTAAAFGGAKGQNKLGVIYCSDGIAVCDAVKNLAPGYAKQFAQPDYTAQCLAARDAGAQMLYVVLDNNGVQRLARSCTSIGYSPNYVLSQPSFSSTLASDPNLARTYGANLTAAASDASVPGIAEFQRVMSQFAPGLDLEGSPMLGWAAAKLFEIAAGSIDEPPTSAQLLAGLVKIQNNDLGGITIPLTFRQGQPAPVLVCWWQVQPKNGQFAKVEGTGRACKPDFKP